MLARILIGVLFTGMFAAEGFVLFLASIHGWPGLLPLGVVFAVAASTIVWILVLRNTAQRPVKVIVGVGAAIASVPVVFALAGVI